MQLGISECFTHACVVAIPRKHCVAVMKVSTLKAVRALCFKPPSCLFVRSCGNIHNNNSCSTVDRSGYNVDLDGYLLIPTYESEAILRRISFVSLANLLKVLLFMKTLRTSRKRLCFDTPNRVDCHASSRPGLLKVSKVQKASDNPWRVWLYRAQAKLTDKLAQLSL